MLRKVENEIILFDGQRDNFIDNLPFDILIKDISNMKDYIEDVEVFDFYLIDNISKADYLDYLLASGSGVFSASMNILWNNLFLDFKTDGVKDLFKQSNILLSKLGIEVDALDKMINKYFNMIRKVKDINFDRNIENKLGNLAHLPNSKGLIFSILSELTEKDYYFDEDGIQISDKKSIVEKDESIGSCILVGITNWAFNTILCFGDALSDLEESSELPESIRKLLLDLSDTEFANNIKNKVEDVDDLYRWFNELFTETHLFKDDNNEVIEVNMKDLLFSLSTAKKEDFAILANDAMIRCFYFLRRLYKEINEKGVTSFHELRMLDAGKFIPYDSRVMIRMSTVSSGAYLAVTEGYRILVKKGFIKIKNKDIVVQVNYPGLGTFITNVKRDGKYIIEDMESLKKSYNLRRFSKYENLDHSVRDIFKLTEIQTQILHSIIFDNIQKDIDFTKDDKERKLKTDWLDSWALGIVETIEQTSDYFIKDPEEIYNLVLTEIISKTDMTWLYLILIEVSQFDFYQPLSPDTIDKYKGLKHEFEYIDAVFKGSQHYLGENEINAFLKSYDKEMAFMKQQTGKALVSVSVGAAGLLAMGSVGFVFAPKIAVALVGSLFPKLSGAALVNASLAFLGGGSLATGGFGMAGGAMVIAGGGALLGGTGSGVIFTFLAANNEDYMLKECAKILTVSKELLKHGIIDAKSIMDIKNLVTHQIFSIRFEFDKMSESEDVDRQYITKSNKNIEQNIKNLERCISGLDKILSEIQTRNLVVQ